MGSFFEDLAAFNNLKEFAGSNSGIGIDIKHVFYRYKIHFIEKTVNREWLQNYKQPFPQMDIYETQSKDRQLYNFVYPLGLEYSGGFWL